MYKSEYKQNKSHIIISIVAKVWNTNKIKATTSRGGELIVTKHNISIVKL